MYPIELLFPITLLQIRKSLSFRIVISKKRWIGCVPGKAILVTADVIRLYQSIPYDVRLKALKQALNRR